MSGNGFRPSSVWRHARRIAFLVALAPLGRSGAADEWARKRFLVFGDDGIGWAEVALPSMEARSIRVAGFNPTGMALAPDGATVVFTSVDDAGKSNLLYRWRLERPDIAPVSIGDTRGYHADPFVSQDGEWVFFAHSPFSRGRPGAHGGMAYAELWKVRLDGSGLEQLTSTVGCHVQPFLDELSRLFYVHVNCGRRGQHIESLLDKGRGEERVLPGEFHLEPDVSPDGHQMLVAVHGPRGFGWERWALGKAPHRIEEGTVPSPSRHVRPHFGRSTAEVLFQGAEGVFVQQSGKQRLLSGFAGGGT